ncbi:MAG: phosphoenolpyruvate--protein phosphotransferase [Acidobacteriota bacterium]
MIRLIGIGVSPGVSWGPVALLLRYPLALRYAITVAHVPRETVRLEQARELTRRQLEQIHARVLSASGPDLAYLFQAQLLMLDDQLLVPRAQAIGAAERINAEWALQRAFDEFCAIFMDTGDGYLRERQGDVADVVGRLRRNTRLGSGDGADVLLDLDEPSILVADDLHPSLAGQLDRRRVLGLAIDAGSRTHHSAILARSMGLPAVVGLGTITRHVRPGVRVLVDGFAGAVVIDPDDELIEQAGTDERRRASVTVTRSDVSHPVTTADGTPVRFEANIERPEEIEAARACGAEGIGLFRSEFLLGSLPLDRLEEEAQYRAYRDLVERMSPHPVTVRTFDVDEGRVVADDEHGAPGLLEMSRGPLGLRAIRLSLDRPEVFATQLRALARAARYGRLRVLFPFVSGVEELREARAALQAACREIAAREGEVPPVQAGVMIEVPSAALTADLLAAEADFFSIGTNDLIQYCLAVDRTDGRVARLYEPLHPAILRVVRQVARVGRQHKKSVAVCGEMAGDPVALLVLLGLGITTFSMSPASIPMARRIVREIRLSRLRRVVAGALKLSTAQDIRAALSDEYPDLARSQQRRDDRPGTEGDHVER